MSETVSPEVIRLVFTAGHLTTLFVEVVVAIAIAVTLAFRPSIPLAVLGLAAVLRVVMTMAYLVAMGFGVDMIRNWPTLIATQGLGLVSILLGGVGLVLLLVEHVRLDRRTDSSSVTGSPFK